MSEKIKLTSLSKTSGCAAKISPHLLSVALNELKESHHIEDDNLLVGFDTSDDAAVYKLTDDIAVVSTLDFFTPVADDGYDFGQIAAANSLSDIYAMGAKPLYALNIVCFPALLDMKILGDILKGGLDKITEAGCSLVGGHSINDDVPKYGLSVNGVVHPDKIMTNNNISLDQDIFLTKPLGIGIINTAVKGGIATKEQEQAAIKSMSKLNKYPEDMIDKFGIKAMTDVTGFGLIGHMSEMARGTDYSIYLETEKLPVIDGTFDYATEGVMPAGLHKNRNHYKIYTECLYEEIAKKPVYDVIFDPQTSGGLLIAVDKEKSDDFKKYLDNSDFLVGSKIASVIKRQEKDIIIA